MGCVDLKPPSECRHADAVWGMCARGDSGALWWHGQCMATCSKCASGLLPCTTPSEDCDPLCFNTKTEAECSQENSRWNMCENAWWQVQCKVFCGRCTGGRPPCSEDAPAVRRRRRQKIEKKVEGGLQKADKEDEVEDYASGVSLASTWHPVAASIVLFVAVLR